MIEVIKHGNTIKSGKCPKCKCEFEFSSKEIHFKDVWGSWDYYVQCPECGEQIKGEEK